MPEILSSQSNLIKQKNQDSSSNSLTLISISGAEDSPLLIMRKFKPFPDNRETPLNSTINTILAKKNKLKSFTTLIWSIFQKSVMKSLKTIPFLILKIIF